MAGGDSFLIPGQQPGTYNRLLQGNPVNPKKTGDWGINSRWSTSWLDGTMGFYYRNTSDIQAQLHSALDAAPLPQNRCTNPVRLLNGAYVTCNINPAVASNQDILNGRIGQYYLVTPSNIDIFGISLSKNIGGISVGAEINYRQNMPLVSDPVTILPIGLANPSLGQITSLPDQGKTGGALGKTWHGVFNLLGTISSTPIFDSATWATELQWNHLASVTQNEAVFRGSNSYAGGDKPTSNYWGLNLIFTPTWFQVFPGVDMSMPLAYGRGLSGHSVVSAGGNEGAGSYSVGVAADVYQKYRFDLKYTDYFGDLWLDPKTGGVASSAGYSALLKDRGFVSLTFKTTF